MSREALAKFRTLLSSTPDLQRTVGEAARSGDVEAIVGIGRRNGHEFTAEELLETFGPDRVEGQLSDAELDLVAGGFGTFATARRSQKTSGG